MNLELATKFEYIPTKFQIDRNSNIFNSKNNKSNRKFKFPPLTPWNSETKIAVAKTIYYLLPKFWLGEFEIVQIMQCYPCKKF